MSNNIEELTATNLENEDEHRHKQLKQDQRYINENEDKNNANDEDNDDDDNQQQQQSSSTNDNDKINSRNNKEEIRRRLAFDIDDYDDPIAQYKASCKKLQQQQKKSKSTLSSRIQNLDSLQICFLNENNNDNNYTFNNFSSNQTHNDCQSNNTNDILMQNRIYYLFKKLQNVNFDLNNIDLFGDIEKPNDPSKFSEYHSKLYAEAKLTLSQIKEICKLRLKIEKENEKEVSSIYDLIHNFPPDFQKGVTKLTTPILRRLRMSELQLIVNDHFSRIEKLNTSLVKLLITRDELYMEQDSLLVDIEDLTKFLLSK